MKRNRKLLIMGLIIGAGAIIGFLLLLSSSTTKIPNIATVGFAQEQAIKTVVALGRLEPQGELIDIGVSGEYRLNRLMVTEGQKVKAGEVLAYLETYSERLAERDQAASQLKINELNIKRLEEVLPLKIKAQEAKVRQLEAELANSKIELERSETLKTDDAVSKQEYDRKFLIVLQSQEGLNHAKILLEELEKTKEIDRFLANAEIEISQAQLQKAYARLKQSIISAPMNGEILKIHTRQGEKTDDGPILQMGNTQQMYAVAEVYETDIVHIRLGQSATISSPALPHPFKGTVDHIGRIIFKNDVLDVDPASDTDARIIEVKILLQESKPVSGLTNLQVTVRISTDS